MVTIAAGDLARFLRQALGVKLAPPRAGRKLLRVSIDPDRRRLRGCSQRRHVIDVRVDKIEIVGASEWGAACGLYHVQRLLKLRRAPCLKLVRIVAVPALDPSLTALAFQPEHLDLQDPLPFHGEYLKRIARTVKRVSPSARFVVWTYGAFTWTRKPDAGDQIARLSQDCTLMANFDTGDQGVREGVRFMHPDYNLTCVGPSSVFRSQARAARRRGMSGLMTTSENTDRAGRKNAPHRCDH